MELYNHNKSRGFEIISVNIQDSGPEVQQFLQRYGATFIGALNRTPTDAFRLYKGRGTPHNVVIDRDGNIVETVVGYGQGDRRLDRALRKAGL